MENTHRLRKTFVLITLLSGILSFTFANSAIAASGPVSVSLSANPTNVNQGDRTTLSWNSTNADFCVAHSNIQNIWFGVRAISGSESITPTQTAIYFITCSNSGYSGTAQTTVTVGSTQTSTVGVSISANPRAIFRGESTTLIWSSTNTVSCEAAGGWSGMKRTFGSEGVSPSQTTTYILTCSNPRGEFSYSAVEIFVNPGGSVSAPSAPGLFNAACVPSQSTVSTGQPITFAGAQSYGTEPVRYSWSGDISGSGQTINTSFSTIGIKTVQLTATDLNGRTAKATCSVQIVSGGTAPAPASPIVRTAKLPAPANLKPNNEELPSDIEKVTLSWTSVKGAKFYAVRAEPTDGTDERDERNNCPGNPHYLCVNQLDSTSIKIEVKPGASYGWWVHAVDANGIFSDPAFASFKIQTEEAKSRGDFFAAILGMGTPFLVSIFLFLIIMAYVAGYMAGKSKRASLNF